MGNLGIDPQMHYTTSGQAVDTYSIAATGTWTDNNNQRQSDTEWFTDVVWENLAETCNSF